MRFGCDIPLWDTILGLLLLYLRNLSLLFPGIIVLLA